MKRVAMAALAGIVATPLAAQTPSELDALRAEVKALHEQLSAVEATLEKVQRKTGVVSRPAPTAKEPTQSVRVVTSTKTTSSDAPDETPKSASPGNVVTGPIDRPAQDANVGAQFQITGSTAEKTAAISIATTLSDPGLKGTTRGVGRFERMSLTFLAPLADQGNTDVATLDGFANSFAFKLRYSSYSVHLRNPLGDKGNTDLVNRAEQACRLRHRGDKDVDKTCSTIEGVKTAFMSEYLSDADYEAYTNQYFPPQTDFLWGVEGGIGYKKFEFYDAATLKKDPASRWPVSAKVFGTILPGFGRTSLTGSVEYQRTFKDAVSVVACAPLTAIGAPKCTYGPTGIPVRKSKVLLAGEARTYVALPENSILPGIGISAQLTYDARNKDFGVDVPIYLVPDATGNVTGGIRVGYTTTDKDVILGVFVGSRFGLKP